MAGEFLKAFSIGQDVGGAIVERRKQRRFNEALSAGDIQQAGLIDPDRLAQQQALEAQRTQMQSGEDTLRRAATVRAFTAAKNLAARTKDPLMAFDTVARISGKTFDPEEVAQARALVEEQGVGAFDLMLDSLSDPTEQKAGQRFYSTGGGLYDTQAGQIIPGTGKAAAERDPLDDEYRRSQIEANRALAEQRRAPKPADAKVADAKVAAAEQTQQAGKEGLSTILGDTAKAFLALDDAGGIVKPGRDVVANVRARVGSSIPGQVVGGAIGDEAQSIRERINNARPLLINAIREATGMSAKSLDSNAELKFYLQAATDPTKDLYSNLAAIETLDKRYGLGGVLDDVIPPEILSEVRAQVGDSVAEEAPVFDDAKKKRLQELRAKRDAGTLR